MITPEQQKKLQASGLSPSQMAQVVKAAGGIGVERQGLNKWMFGNRTSLPGMALEAGSNILSVPSYALGGMMDEFQQKGAGALNPLKNPLGLAGAYSGIKNKEAIMRELPESFGMDPNSGAGMALGFAGELMTPGIPLGKIANVFKGGKAASRLAGAASKPNIFAKGAEALGEGIETQGKNLAVKALRPSTTQIKKIKKVTGMDIADFIAKNDLYGQGDIATKKADELIRPIQEYYNSLVRNGVRVDPKEYSQALLTRAQEIKAQDFSPEAQAVVENLRNRATLFQQQAKKMKGGIPIDILTNTKSSAYSKVPGSVMQNPSMYHGGEIAGEVGIDVLEKLAPGSAKYGKELQALRTFKEIAEQQAGLSRGSQPMNGVKSGLTAPGAFIGGVPGALAGYAAEQVINSPKFLSKAGSTSGRVGNFLKTNANEIGDAAQSGVKSGGRFLGTAARVLPMMQRRPDQSQSSQTTIQQIPSPFQNTMPNTPAQQTQGMSQPSSYPGSIPPAQNVKQLQYKPPTTRLQTNTAFGKNKQVKRGSFY